MNMIALNRRLLALLARFYVAKAEKKCHWLSLPYHLKSKHFSNQIEEKDQANNNSISCSKKACCHETICLDWFYHLSCTYAHSQSSLKRFLSRNVHVYIKTITDYIFRRSPHFLFRSFVYISTCVCVYIHMMVMCLYVNGFLLYFIFSFLR